MPKEAQARIKINKQLEEAGWRFLDSDQGPANVVLEMGVKLKKKDVDALGEDFEKTKQGYVDFLLLDEKGFPLVVLEAKREEKNPLDGKEQARSYAKNLNVRFIILTNGNIHYFWDLTRGNPAVISSFPTPESVAQFHAYQPNPAALAREKVADDYIVLTQLPTYAIDPRWSDEAERASMIDALGLRFLRKYQLEAVHTLQEAAGAGNDRYLFEMATGTGKTLVAAAVIKLFLRTGNARRVLFLVDRLELEDQAKKSFVNYLKNDYTTVIYKENRDDWRKAEIVVTTVQSLTTSDRYRTRFSPTDFDLVISDEAHRSINGNARAVFEYFLGFKLGLTATPRDYLKNIDPDKLSQQDPRAWERRQLLDTYKTFGCESGTPTFRYSLMDGVADGFLVNPIVADARTEITTQLLSDKGYAVVVRAEDGQDEEHLFFLQDFERKFFSEKTNHIFCKAFLENALTDPVSGEIGKSIVFCVSQRHASTLTQILNQYADQLWPGRYESDFAVQVTSNIPDAQQFAVNFANNRLNGYTRWLQGYKSSRTRVCVTVGMMTTGYDCQDILNLCLARPIFSPTDFIQMKGRGTRRWRFAHATREAGEKHAVTADKEHFKLFDFFANCEYFEEKYDYDQVIQLPQPGEGGRTGPGPEPPRADEVTIHIPDPLKTFEEAHVGPRGMRVDRELFQRFQEKVKADPFIRERYEQGDMPAVEDYVRTEIFDKPEDYVNLQKIRQALRLDRRPRLAEVLDFIFGRTPHLKSKDELLDDEVEKFVAIHKPDSGDVHAIRSFLKAYISDAEVRRIVDSRQFAQLATNPRVSMADLRALGNWRDVIPEYVKDYVAINTYM